jgi:hypothetical protein
MAALSLTPGNILTGNGLMEEPNCLLSEGEKEKGFNTEVTEGPQRERRVREGIFKAEVRKERGKEEACTGAPRPGRGKRRTQRFAEEEGRQHRVHGGRREEVEELKVKS